MTTTWQTLYDKMIVRRHDADKMVKGIAVAETHEKQKNTGMVVSIGSGRLMAGTYGTQALVISTGMEVLFHEHSGVPLDPDDDSLIILREDEILAYRWPETKMSAVAV